MEHDELCSQPGLPTGVCFECADIQTIRASERERAVQRVDALPWDVAVSFGPIDCNYSCEEGPCTCSGEMRPEAWTTGPAAVIAAIKGEQT